MSNVGDLANKAEQFGEDHPEDVDKGIDKAEKVADERTGNKYDKQLQEGGEQLEKRLGGGQDQQQGQDQQGGSQQGQ